MSQITYTAKQVQKKIDDAIEPYRKCLHASWQAIFLEDEYAKDFAVNLMIKISTKNAKPPTKETCKLMANLYFDAGFYEAGLYYANAFWDYKKWVKQEWPLSHTNKVLAGWLFERK